MTQTFYDETLFGISYFGHWNLFDIWNLLFGISTSELNSNPRLPSLFLQPSAYLLTIHGKLGYFRQFDPFIEVKTIISGFGRLYFSICHTAVAIRFPDDDSPVQDGRPFVDIEECVGLLGGNNAVQAVGIFHLFLKIILLTDADDELIGLRIFKTDEIKLVGTGLAGMPDLIQVRIDAHLPAQNQGVKIQFVDAFLNKNRPLQQVGADIDPDFFPAVLSNGQYGFTQFVAAVADQGKLEPFAARSIQSV